MSTPSNLGDLGHQVAVLAAYDTSTVASVNVIAGTDTGTVATTGQTLDLSKPIGYSNTGGKPLDKDVNPKSRIVRQFRSIGVAGGLELVYHTSGKNIHVSVAHKTRSATAGAGSTWETLRTEVFRFKGGTDTDVTLNHGFCSTVNTQAVKRYYKANISVIRKKASSTSAKDTTTDSAVLMKSAVYLGAGEVNYPAQENEVGVIGG